MLKITTTALIVLCSSLCTSYHQIFDEISKLRPFIYMYMGSLSENNVFCRTSTKMFYQDVPGMFYLFLIHPFTERGR